MFFGKRKPRPKAARRPARFRPVGDPLERRDLLALLSLLNAGVSPNINGTPTDPPAQPAVPPDALGVQFTANLVQTQDGLNLNNPGFSVAVVGDVNGDGFDDFLISAPTTTINNGIATTVPNTSGQVYLVFGSREVNQPQGTNSNFLGLVNNVEVPVGNPQGRPPRQAINERVGNLSNLGTTLQRSPINNLSGFDFDGLTFVTNGVPNDELGFMVAAAGDVDGDGLADFMIGAPGADGGAGRVYLVYGSSLFNNLGTINKTIDLNAPLVNQPPGVQFTTITGTPLGSRLGQSGAGVGDVITDGTSDIAIGAPFASFNNLANSGATYLISGGVFRNPGQPRPVTINLANFGAIGDTRGVLITGEAAGDLSGWSVARAGNFDGDSASGLPQEDLLIGAPGDPFGLPNTPGRASLVYGATNLISRFTLAGLPPVFSLATLGDPADGATVAGATFVGEVNGDLTGFAVSSAGDFNNDGVGDILIGSPKFGGQAGRANLIYGRRAADGRIVGEFGLSDILPEDIPFLELLGEGPGARAGYSLASVATLNNDAINEILIGSPGFANNSGAAYLVAGNPNNLNGIFSLSDVVLDVIPGIQFTLARGAGFLGASVAGIRPPARNRTVDLDTQGDFLISAQFDQPQFPVNSFGSTFLLQGGLVPLATPPVGPPTPPPPGPPGPGPGIFVPGPAVRVFFPTINAAAPRYGESFTPTAEALSKLNGYKPLPPRVAFQQFGPLEGFGTRYHGFFDPSEHRRLPISSGRSDRRDGIFVLPDNVFTRGRFKVGQIPGRINHGIPTIPLQTPRRR